MKTSPVQVFQNPEQVGVSPHAYPSALLRWAKMEVLKDKVKARVARKCGPQLDRLADLIVDVMTE